MRVEALAVTLMVLGVSLVGATRVGLAGALLVAGGACVLMLPEFIDHEQAVPQ